nr:MAG TPA: ESCRT-I subunit Mvb12 [Caudoviricetes sp.]
MTTGITSTHLNAWIEDCACVGIRYANIFALASSPIIPLSISH